MSLDDDLRDLERQAAQGEPSAAERLALAMRRAGLASSPIVLPALGESITEATLSEWCVGPGDVVRKDQVIAVLDTDKVCVELPAPEDGVIMGLELPPGSVVKVGAALGRIANTRPLDPAVEDAHAALLARIVAAPHDEALRVEYATFLSTIAAGGAGVGMWGRETTALRGELIALHHATGDAYERHRRLRQHTTRLTRTALDLVGCEPPGDAIVVGGFVSGLHGSARSIAERWRALVELAPLTALSITRLDDAAPILGLPRLEQVRTLTLGPDAQPAAVDALARSGRLRIRRLALRGAEAATSLAMFGASAVVLHELAPLAWLTGSSVERLHLVLSQLRGPQLEQRLRALRDLPASVQAISVRAWSGEYYLLDGELADLVGPRFVRGDPW